MRTFSVLWAAGLVALSATAAAAAPGADSAEAKAFLQRVAGVYKNRFQNGLVSGERYESEDILEVVPVDSQHAYIRMDLQFYNGHSGGITGVAAYSGHDSLVYDNREGGSNHCILTITWSTQTVTTNADYEKTPGCRNYHGARGTLNQVEFKVAKRRDIRYLQRLKDSREFKAAMEEYGRRAAQ